MTQENHIPKPIYQSYHIFSILLLTIVLAVKEILDTKKTSTEITYIVLQAEL